MRIILFRPHEPSRGISLNETHANVVCRNERELSKWAEILLQQMSSNVNISAKFAINCQTVIFLVNKVSRKLARGNLFEGMPLARRSRPYLNSMAARARNTNFPQAVGNQCTIVASGGDVWYCAFCWPDGPHRCFLYACIIVSRVLHIKYLVPY